MRHKDYGSDAVLAERERASLKLDPGGTGVLDISRSARAAEFTARQPRIYWGEVYPARFGYWAQGLETLVNIGVTDSGWLFWRPTKQAAKARVDRWIAKKERQEQRRSQVVRR